MKNIGLPHNGLKGQYKTVLTKGDGTVVESPWFDNIILNTGLDILGSRTTGFAMGFLRLGTGTSAPSVTQTNVESFLATVGNNIPNSHVNLGAPNFHSVSTIGYAFPQGAVIGNVTELATSPNSGSIGECFSRSLIVDNTNTPTALTVTAIDQLTVYYKMTVITSTADFVGSFVINGVTHNYTGRKARIESTFSNIAAGFNSSFSLMSQAIYYTNNASLGPITESLLGTQGSNPTLFSERDVYTPGSHTCAQQVLYPATAGYNTPIKGFYIFFSDGNNQYQIVLDTAIPKTSSNELKIKFGFSWGRV